MTQEMYLRLAIRVQKSDRENAGKVNAHAMLISDLWREIVAYHHHETKDKSESHNEHQGINC